MDALAAGRVGKGESDGIRNWEGAGDRQSRPPSLIHTWVKNLAFIYVV